MVEQHVERRRLAVSSASSDTGNGRVTGSGCHCGINYVHCSTQTPSSTQNSNTTQKTDDKG